MKKILLILFGLLLLLPKPVYANGAGLPPFFLVNGKMSIANPLQIFGITASSFLIPQDFTPENYVVNTPIDFNIDTDQLKSIILPEFMNKTKFEWDFGDGTTAEGLQNTHTYTHMGSYILILTINVYTYERDTTPTQFIDSFLINVLPSKDFHDLPQAVIKINNRQVTDPINNVLQLNLTKSNIFNASSSKSQSGIVQYFWNFGDGQTSSKATDTHRYIQPSLKTVVLRVKDKNGFISDAFVGLENGSSTDTPAEAQNPYKNQSPAPDKLNQFVQLGLVPLLMISGAGIVYLLLGRRGKKV